MENKDLETETAVNDTPLDITVADTSAEEISKSEEKVPSAFNKSSEIWEASALTTSKAESKIAESKVAESKVVESSDKIKHKKGSKKKASKSTKQSNLDSNNKSVVQSSSENIGEVNVNHQIGNLSQRLEKCQLEPITIDPGPNAKTISITHEETLSPRVIKLNQTFKFPSEFEANYEEKHSPTKECFTQTSKTFVTTTVENDDTPEPIYIPPEIPVEVDEFVDTNEVERPLSCTPPLEENREYGYPVDVLYDSHQSNNEYEEICTPNNSDNFVNIGVFGQRHSIQPLKLPPIPSKRTNSNNPPPCNTVWPQALITGPVEFPTVSPLVIPPIGDLLTRAKSQTLPLIINRPINLRSDNLKRSLSQRPLNPSHYTPLPVYNTNADKTQPAEATNDYETHSRSEPFILPALNNQNRPELQLLQRLLPPNPFKMPEPYKEPPNVDEINPQFNKLSSASSKSPDLTWHLAPQAIRSDTSNESVYAPRHVPEDLAVQLYSNTKLSPQLIKQKSTVVPTGSRLSFHSSTKFSPRNDNYSMLSQKTGKSLACRDSRPTSGSICKRRVTKYGSTANRCLTRKLSATKRNIPTKRSYQSSNTEEQNAASETESVTTRTSTFTASAETVSLPKAIAHVNSDDWEVAMKGMMEIVELSRHMEFEMLEQEMPAINRKIIQMLRSPRSQACRVACEVSGELFVTMKLTKRPEFDEIVDLLLCKTADTNRFIRKDANIALDRMVTYIPPFHAVRALCSKGPGHKNHLVRCATVRLLVCIAVLAGVDNILTNNEYTRKRMFTTMAKFLMDKHLDTRKYGERLFKMFKRNKYFEDAFYRDVDMDIIEKLGKSLLRLTRK